MIKGGPNVGQHLGLLRAYYPGYSVTWLGSFVGLWGVALTIFLGLGGMLACAGRDSGRAPVLFTVLHGLGLLVVVVAGIGRAHKLEYGWPAWMLLKIGCWLVIAVLPALARRGKIPPTVAVVLAVLLGFAAIWIAVNKPFLG